MYFYKKSVYIFLSGFMLFLASCGNLRVQAAEQAEPFVANFQELEENHQAILGVYAWNTENGKIVAYGADRRFIYCSTFKVFLVGELLQQRSLEDLNETVHYTKKDILAYAPVTSKSMDTGMSLGDLSAAALRVSDNTAANLLLEQIGGIDALKKSFRQLGDDVTEPVRPEPDLNETAPGDLRDTSTPRQLAVDLHAYLMGDILPEEKRQQLQQWLSDNPVTDPLIKAGVPSGWIVIDKSGSGSYGTRNDIAMMIPPGKKPIILAIMTTHDKENAKSDNALVAETAKLVISQLAD